jgi:hypothetical protein
MLEPFELDITMFDPEESEESEEHEVLDVWAGKRWDSELRRNNHRAVCVEWFDKTVSVEPVCNLIDNFSQTINEKMIPVLNNWINHSTKKGRCLFCKYGATTEILTCSICYEKSKWLKQFVNVKYNKMLPMKRKHE